MAIRLKRLCLQTVYKCRPNTIQIKIPSYWMLMLTMVLLMLVRGLLLLMFMMEVCDWMTRKTKRKPNKEETMVYIEYKRLNACRKNKLLVGHWSGGIKWRTKDCIKALAIGQLMPWLWIVLKFRIKENKIIITENHFSTRNYEATSCDITDNWTQTKMCVYWCECVNCTGEHCVLPHIWTCNI